MNRDVIFLVSFFLYLGFCTLLVFNESQKNQIRPDIVFERYDRVANVSCHSDSMGLTLGCMDRLGEIKINPEDDLQLGRIYIYNNQELNISVVHRLVACVDQNCTQLVFKGDNNKIGEIINRSQVMYLVDIVDYN